jgi:hypothetical protein
MFILLAIYFISFVLRTVRARPLWAVAIRRRPDKCIDMNEAMFTYLHACIIKDFCGTHHLHAQVVMHTLTNSKIYCRLCTTTATTTTTTTTTITTITTATTILNITTDNNLSAV